VWPVHKENILDRLSAERGPRRLSGEQVKRIAKAMEMLRTTAAELYQRPAASPA
jgi:hypothetical protein